MSGVRSQEIVQQNADAARRMLSSMSNSALSYQQVANQMSSIPDTRLWYDPATGKTVNAPLTSMYGNPVPQYFTPSQGLGNTGSSWSNNPAGAQTFVSNPPSGPTTYNVYSGNNPQNSLMGTQNRYSNYTSYNQADPKNLLTWTDDQLNQSFTRPNLGLTFASLQYARQGAGKPLLSKDATYTQIVDAVRSMSARESQAFEARLVKFVNDAAEDDGWLEMLTHPAVIGSAFLAPIVATAGLAAGGVTSGLATAGNIGGVAAGAGAGIGGAAIGGVAGGLGLAPGSAGSAGTIGTGMGVPVGGNMAGAGMGTGMYGGGAIGAGGYTSIPAAGLGPNVFNVGNIPSSPGGVSGGTNIGGVGTSANVTTNPFPGLTGATGPTGAPIAGNTLSFIDKIGLYFPSLGISNSTAMNIGGKLLSFLGSGQASQDQLDLLKQMQASNKAEFDRMMADSPYGPAAAAIIADILGGTSPGGQVVEAALREAQRLGAKGGYMGNSLNLADLSAQSLLRAGALSIEGAQVLANLYGTDLEALSNYLNTNMAYDTTRVHLTGQQPNWLNVAGKSLTALSGLLIPRG